MCIAFDSVILLLEIHHIETKSQTQKAVCRKVFTAALLVTPKWLATTWTAINKVMVKYIKVHPH